MDGVLTMDASQSRSENGGGVNGADGCGYAGGKGWISIRVRHRKTSNYCFNF